MRLKPYVIVLALLFAAGWLCLGPMGVFLGALFFGFVYAVARLFWAVINRLER